VTVPTIPEWLAANIRAEAASIADDLHALPEGTLVEVGGETVAYTGRVLSIRKGGDRVVGDLRRPDGTAVKSTNRLQVVEFRVKVSGAVTASGHLVASLVARVAP